MSLPVRQNLNLENADEIHHMPGGALQIIVGRREFILGADLLRAIRNTPEWRE